VNAFIWAVGHGVSLGTTSDPVVGAERRGLEVIHGAPMSPEVARRVFHVFRQIQPPERAEYALTPHEVRLLKLLVEGHSYKTAAVELGVSAHTVSFDVVKQKQFLRHTCLSLTSTPQMTGDKKCAPR
jgi:hypothetical protein